MDRQAVIGFVLIAVIFIVWMFYMAPEPQPQQPKAEQPSAAAQEQQVQKDTNVSLPSSTDTAVDTLAPSIPQQRFGRWFAETSDGEKRSIVVETEKYIAEISTHGGSIARWTLKGFNTWDGRPLQLIDWKRSSDFNLVFASSDGRYIDTKDLYFQISTEKNHSRAKLADNDSLVVEARLPVKGDSAAIVKRYVFRGSGYAIDLDVEMHNMADIIANYEYQLTVHSPALTEANSVEEASFAEAHAFVDGKRDYLDATSESEKEKLNKEGEALWMSVNNKYFTHAVMARDGFVGTGVYLEGIMIPQRNKGQRELYEAAFRVKYRGREVERSTFSLYLGPMDYDELKSQYEGLEQTLSLGWAFIVRPFSEYLVMPLFSFLHGFIPNFGWVIIIFSILIKILLHPLTKTSMKSMQRMQKLQPMMNELREKYKDDQQKQNMEIMKLYKEYGVNPAGGCLPMLLQFPILFALFSIFRSTIDLRQEPFMLWITDLSGPDIMFRLPFELPLLGMSFVSGLALLMSITMFIQQKMSIKDPRQKAMVYMMPVMFWILFNSFPSGLNLYYFMFNLLSIGQQWYINKKHENEPLVKVAPKNGKNKLSWTERAMANMQEKAKQQGKSSKSGKKF
ncbi:MAG: membrane protein insertase YidC [Bacteroidia bacterium]|nr:membrane protein insertase YidC [Bacteroidia bacterium]